jgi:hypothetical protein
MTNIVWHCSFDPPTQNTIKVDIEENSSIKCQLRTYFVVVIMSFQPATLTKTHEDPLHMGGMPL